MHQLQALEVNFIQAFVKRSKILLIRFCPAHLRESAQPWEHLPLAVFETEDSLTPAVCLHADNQVSVAHSAYRIEIVNVLQSSHSADVRVIVVLRELAMIEVEAFVWSEHDVVAQSYSLCACLGRIPSHDCVIFRQLLFHDFIPSDHLPSVLVDEGCDLAVEPALIVHWVLDILTLPNSLTLGAFKPIIRKNFIASDVNIFRVKYFHCLGQNVLQKLNGLLISKAIIWLEYSPLILNRYWKINAA